MASERGRFGGWPASARRMSALGQKRTLTAPVDLVRFVPLADVRSAIPDYDSTSCICAYRTKLPKSTSAPIT